MDFLEKLVIPATTSHLYLLKVMLILSLLIFIPFLGMLIGGTAFSVIFNTYGRKIKSVLFVRFAKDIIDKLAINRFVGVGLGVVPLLSITFCYAQLLYQVNVICVSLLFMATLFMIISINFIYSYQNTFQIESLVGTLTSISGIYKHEIDVKIPEDIIDYEFDLMNANSNSGLYGLIMLLISGFFFTAGTTIALYSDRYQDFQNIAQIFLSGASYVNFLFLLIISVAVTGSAILFFFFSWQGGLFNMDKEYSNFVKKIAGNIAFTGAALLPIVIFMSFFVIPNVALSGSVFMWTGFSLVSVLMLCNFIYAVIKNSDLKYISAVFYFMILSVGFIVLINQSAFATASIKNLETISIKADELEKEKKSKTVNTSGVNGEEVYTRVCAACHKFDTKLVGPPYDQTVPTYNGDVKKLASYIMNPVKKNPDYPPMPAPPIKQKEAEAVAQYLIDKVSGKK
ncbi:MAG: hypothetical protein HGGPFJEG_00078 [Ignavibacteria bacterium]|nr:hypothetical protein [Ignavibacteria bacterium]